MRREGSDVPTTPGRCRIHKDEETEQDETESKHGNHEWPSPVRREAFSCS